MHHADERLSALGQASGNAEAAAEALSAVRRALSGRTLESHHIRALQEQVHVFDMLSSAARGFDKPTRASMLVQQGPWAVRNLSNLMERIDLPVSEKASALLARAKTALTALATGVDYNRQDAEAAADLCKRLLNAALGMVGTANQPHAFGAAGKDRSK